METWVLALICTALALGGAMIGAVSVFAVIRYRRHRQMKHRSSCTGCEDKKCLGSCIHPADGIVSEELASGLTAAEKQVLHKIACYNGAISLTLRLPEPSLGIPLSPAALPTGTTKGARFSLSSADALSMPLPPSHIVNVETMAPQTASGCYNSTAADERPITHCSTDPPQQPCTNATDAVSDASENQTQEQPPQNPQSDADAAATTTTTAAAAAATITTASNQQTDADTSSIGRASIRSFKSLQSKLTKVQGIISKRADWSETQGAVSWSSPVDDRSRKSMAFDTIVAAPNSKIIDSSDSDSSHDGSGCSPRDHTAPSMAESNPETISTGTPPGSPRTLASPCNSFDYVFIPPSPSISSLYGVSAMDTLSHAPSALSNPRSATLAKSVSSPGAAAGQASLFSPPPMAFHQKYFENHSPRSPIVRTSSSDKV
ncbi:hypothetical protein IW140_003455 [Coemansia sp. RSA 1813]|nr:hypothetical protein EV178_000855 [Coemansia sp. RSA 1646]KAJ2088433.1 hypothetical protein IW138_004211 [Coemansia sp. RSA 986]KAJ2213527.1 hypothetical protein EV179_003752 [Coemansia sp. RSA 487]KAJ2568949.1 hypothetical protein IW140_003455 [Coemansia sp. RSA 1813]